MLCDHDTYRSAFRHCPRQRAHYNVLRSDRVAQSHPDVGCLAPFVDYSLTAAALRSIICLTLRVGTM